MRKLLLFFIGSLIFFSCNNGKGPGTAKIKSVTTDSTEGPKAIRNANTWTPVDVSPMDMNYFPVDYPKTKTDSTRTTPVARLIYSRPHLQGRTLFNDILKYGEPWRLGANEATELQFYKPALIQGKSIKAGRYVLYCIPEKTSWTIVLNSNIDSWGLHPDSTKDIARFILPVQNTPDALEYFTMLFRNNNGIAELYMAWDHTEAVLPISFP